MTSRVSSTGASPVRPSPAPQPKGAKPVIAVIAFDRISPFHLSVPCVVFGEDRGDGGVPAFDFRVCAAEPGPLSTTAGFSIAATHGRYANRPPHGWRAGTPPCRPTTYRVRYPRRHRQ